MTHPNETLIQRLRSDLEVWRVPGNPAATAEDAKQMAKEPFVYCLRMLWQGRHSKLSVERRETLNDASIAHLPISIGYTGASDSTSVMPEENHHTLADLVFEAVWADYVLLVGKDDPLFQPKKGFLYRFKSRFSKK